MSSSDRRQQQYEFGGPWGAAALIVWSHAVLLYFWYCLDQFDGQPALPNWDTFSTLFRTKGIPSATTWIIFLLFYGVQLILASFMPGISCYGRPTPPHGVRLIYHCNGWSCYYLCFISLLVGHLCGFWDLSYIADHFGEMLIASLIIGDVTSLWWYFYGLYQVYTIGNNDTVDQLYVQEQQSLTGNWLYDFFMGTVLYPRIGEVDIKMLAECRWSWNMLFLITISCAAKQYQSTGKVSFQLAHMLLAHWLYSNATAKGEHAIPFTWDMFREKYGWMLNFWNLSGVPFLYCFQSMYILYNQEKIDNTYPVWLIPINAVLLLAAYYVWDTANGQKASFKNHIKRTWVFPQFSFDTLEAPVRVLHTDKGDLLIDGWYAFVRKAQYSADSMMALSWGLACGFASPLPYFYFLFFTGMIIHRQNRDEARCSAKYGDYWEIYKRAVPNVFVPNVASLFRYWSTGQRPRFPEIERSNERFLAERAHAGTTGGVSVAYERAGAGAGAADVGTSAALVAPTSAPIKAVSLTPPQDHAAEEVLGGDGLINSV